MRIKTLLIYAILLVGLGAAAYAETKASTATTHAMPPISTKISLHVQSIAIKAALQLLAEFSGSNMVISDTVTGNITLNFHDVSFNEALDIILTTKFLSKKRVGNVLFIASERELAKYAVNKHTMQMQKEALAPLHAKLVQVNYAKASEIAAILQNKVDTFLSNRGRLIADIRTNTIWIRDTDQRIAVVKHLIRQLDIPVAQILLEAKIVNVTKDFAKELGLHFTMERPNAAQSINMTRQKRGNSANFLEGLNFDIGGLPVPANVPGLSLAYAKLGDGILLDLELSALESEGRGKVIARPKLIATNQQPALIESGEEIPYQEASASGATAIVFKKAALSLQVTPNITPNGQILLALQINQDIPTPRVFNGVPTILTKEIQTSVLAKNNQTIVLGGIYKQDQNKEINRIPFLGKLPIVGRLFQYQMLSLRDEELLIFITPRIIYS